MSKAMLLGVRDMKGEFQGNPYHTIALHISEKFGEDKTTANVKSYGNEVSVQKVKYERLPFILSSPIEGVKDFAERFIGSQIDISYDKDGKVTSIVLFPDMDEPTAKK